ncbi:MAG: hypothetical protein JKY05_05690 [SAR324 cluster bacterium]|nr:hypothetical protein [SAR324 cluster bacterium]
MPPAAALLSPRGNASAHSVCGCRSHSLDYCGKMQRQIAETPLPAFPRERTPGLTAPDPWRVPGSS